MTDKHTAAVEDDMPNEIWAQTQRFSDNKNFGSWSVHQDTHRTKYIRVIQEDQGIECVQKSCISPDACKEKDCCQNTHPQPQSAVDGAMPTEIYAFKMLGDLGNDWHPSTCNDYDPENIGAHYTRTDKIAQPQSAGRDGLIKALNVVKKIACDNDSTAENRVLRMHYHAEQALSSFKSPPVADKWQTMESAPMNRTEILVACWFPPISDDDHGMWGYDVVAYQAIDYPPTKCGWVLSGHGGEKDYEVFPSFWRHIPDLIPNKVGHDLKLLPEPPVAGGADHE